MPRYNVRVEKGNNHRRTVTIDADSDEQARRRATDGGGRVIWIDEIYSGGDERHNGDPGYGGTEWETVNPDGS